MWHCLHIVILRSLCGWNTERLQETGYGCPSSDALSLSVTWSDYPHKYGPEGGCADPSVFEQMKRYQASALEEAVSVYSEQAQRCESQVMRRLCSPHRSRVWMITSYWGRGGWHRWRRTPASSSSKPITSSTSTTRAERQSSLRCVLTGPSAGPVMLMLVLMMLCVPVQISSHVKAIDAIYQGTDFMGIRNISFMVKRIRVTSSLIIISPYWPQYKTMFLLEMHLKKSRLWHVNNTHMTVGGATHAYSRDYRLHL